MAKFLYLKQKNGMSQYEEGKEISNTTHTYTHITTKSGTIGKPKVEVTF